MWARLSIPVALKVSPLLSDLLDCLDLLVSLSLCLWLSLGFISLHLWLLEVFFASLFLSSLVLSILRFQHLVVFSPSCSPPASPSPFLVWSYLTSFIWFSPTVSILQSDFFFWKSNCLSPFDLSSTPFASHFPLESFFLPLHFCLSPVLSPSLSSSLSISLSKILSHNCLKL